MSGSDAAAAALGRLVSAVDEFLLGCMAKPAPARPPAGERGLARHRRAHGELRAATAGVLFLRNKLEAEQVERRVHMARACHALLRAVREDDDETALSLLAYRDVLRRRLRAAEEELAGLRTQAADATESLARLSRAVGRLERRQHGRPEPPVRARAAHRFECGR